jgi:hypothetical protein
VTASWETTLSELEARIDSTERGIGARDVDALAPFTPPGDRGPLPVELGERARAILERGDDAVALAEAEQERLRAELRRLPRHPAHQPPASTFRAQA